MITNTRETGKLEVQKDLSPSTDDPACSTSRSTATPTDATDVGDGGSTGEETLNTGDHTVGETAGTDTDLADYAEVDRLQGRQRHRCDGGQHPPPTTRAR